MLLDTLQEAHERGVTLASGLPAAADLLEQGREFGLILVQDRLSGLSHELILRHLRAKLADSSPLIVLATDSPDIHDADPNLYPLDLSLPDSELIRQLERLLSKLPKSSFDGDIVSSVQEATMAVLPDLQRDPLPQEPLEEAVVATADNDAPLPAEQAPPEGVGSRFAAELETEIARREETVIPQGLQQESEPLITLSEFMTVAESPKQSFKGVKLLFLSAGVLLLLVASWRYFSAGPDLKQPIAAESGEPRKVPQPVQAKITSVATPKVLGQFPLPRFIARVSPTHDPSYTATHQGWERFVASDIEFKIFRESDKLTAVQVVGKGSAGLPPALFSAAMRELAGVGDYRTTGREQQGDYLVKRGTLGKSGTVTIYKDLGDARLHGFVITLN